MSQEKPNHIPYTEKYSAETLQSFGVDKLNHPHQAALIEKVLEGNLPDGAEALLREAILDTQKVYARDKKFKGTSLRINLGYELDDEQFKVEHSNIFKVSFAGENRTTTDEMGFAVTAMVHLDAFPDAKIYPSGIRHIPLDTNGNAERQFLLWLPKKYRGFQSGFEYEVLNGGGLMLREKLMLSPR